MTKSLNFFLGKKSRYFIDVYNYQRVFIAWNKSIFTFLIYDLVDPSNSDNLNNPNNVCCIEDGYYDIEFFENRSPKYYKEVTGEELILEIIKERLTGESL